MFLNSPGFPLRQRGESTRGNWVNDSKWSYTYDASGNMLTELGQNWETWLGNWVNSYKVELWYDSYISAIGDEADPSLTQTSFCSPNPANEKITVNNPLAKGASLKVFNMAGTLMHETQLASGQNTIPVQKLPQGIYLFVVQAGNSVIQNKVVVY